MALLRRCFAGLSPRGHRLRADPRGGKAPDCIGLPQDQPAGRIGQLLGRFFLSEARIRHRGADFHWQADRVVCQSGHVVTPTIVLEENPSAHIRSALMDLMLVYNERKAGPSGFAPLAMVLSDPAT